jgi:hypothetical protein
MLPAAAWSLLGSEPELHPEPHRHRHAVRTARTAAEAPVTIRRARPQDAALVSALAALDSSRPLEGDALVAELGGAPIAALELASGRTVADPFARTAEAASLLRVRAAQLRAAQRHSTRRRVRPLAAVTGLLR